MLYRPACPRWFLWGLAQPAIGLDYYVARWYDPALGRFVQPDSIIPDPEKAKGYDRYTYVENNPVLNNDPTGHIAMAVVMPVVVLAVAVVAYGVAYEQSPQFRQSADQVSKAITNKIDEQVEIYSKNIETAQKVYNNAREVVGGLGVIAYAELTSQNKSSVNGSEGGNATQGNCEGINSCNNKKKDKEENVTGKPRTIDKFLEDAGNFLGKNYEQIGPGVYRSIELLRQVRITASDLSNKVPHGHFEILNNLEKVVKNIHIPLINFHY